jgi:hypothetical protein
MTASAGHLGDLVCAYVERTLPAELLRRLDRHLVTCGVCGAAVDAERRLLISLRSARTPGVPTSLTMALRELAVSGAAPVPAPALVRTSHGPAYRTAVSLPLVAAGAPALHRSLARAAMLAGLAAGASAAAAWGFSAVGVAGMSSVPATPAGAVNSLRLSRPSSPSAPLPTTGASRPAPVIAGASATAAGGPWGLTVSAIVPAVTGSGTGTGGATGTVPGGDTTGTGIGTTGSAGSASAGAASVVAAGFFPAFTLLAGRPLAAAAGTWWPASPSPTTAPRSANGNFARHSGHD